MKLWIGNLDPKATDDEVRELVSKYTQLEIIALTRYPGEGSRPAVMLEFAGGDFKALDAAQRRLNGMHWKNRSLTVTIPSA